MASHPPTSPWRVPVDAGDPELDALLEHLKRLRGVDFTGYKRSTLARRVSRRLQAIDCLSYDAYADVIEHDPVELDLLIDSILINVTAFLRDGEAWAHLRRDVLPELAAGDGPIRVWSAGCATGEETYSVAMLLTEALGEAGYLERVKIYATDIDETALAVARAGVYTAQRAAPVPVADRARYFDDRDGTYTFRKELRRRIIFGRNDLVRDAPISRIDLLLCRNTFIYFNAATQAEVLRRFNFALRPTGFLFAGKSEMLITHSRYFTPFDLKRRIFRRVEVRRERGVGGHAAGAARRDATEAMARQAFDDAPGAQVVFDDRGDVALVNREGRLRLEGEGAVQALAADPVVGELLARAREGRRPAGPCPVTLDGVTLDAVALPLLALGRVSGVALQLHVVHGALPDGVAPAPVTPPDAPVTRLVPGTVPPLARLLRAAGVASIALDAEGIVTRWDEPAAALLGPAADAALGRSLDALGTALPPAAVLADGPAATVIEVRAGDRRLIVRASTRAGGTDLLVTRRGLVPNGVDAVAPISRPAT